MVGVYDLGEYSSHIDVHEAHNACELDEQVIDYSTSSVRVCLSVCVCTDGAKRTQ